MSIPLRFLLNFVIILLIQILILNDVVIRSSITIFTIPVFTPFIYPLILLLLPVNTSRIVTMILGFVIGIIVDFFCNTPGMHASALVLIAFLRGHILSLFFQQNIKEVGEITPSISRMGFTSFLLYITISIFIHHFYFYIIQYWSISKFFIILFKTILSSTVTIVLILLAQLLFYKPKISNV